MKIHSNRAASLARCFTKSIRRCMSTENPPVAYECGPDMQEQGICAVDSCKPNLCYPEPRVVIIGAGMAGLSAAARLTQRNITNFVVLEAYERPGGRIHSCFLGDVVAELGAQWRPPNTTNNFIYEISATENPPRPGLPALAHPRGLFNRVVTGKMEYPATISAYHKFRQIEEEATALYCLGGNKQQGSLINFMSLRIQQELHEYPEEHQHDAARIMFGLAHMLSARSGSDSAMLCADHSGCFMNMPGGEARVPLGQIGVLAPILRQIPEGTIRYCKPVNCVYWGVSQKEGFRATVCTNDGEEFPCDYVIITASLGVLRERCDRLFCPALPSSKMDAMRCLGFGHCNRIYMAYSRPFWYWHLGSLKFEYPSCQCCGCDWTRGIRLLEQVPHSNHVISAVVVGQEALMMEGLCEKDVAEGITTFLRRNTGNESIPYPASIIRSQWSSDPYFLGAYSFDPCCKDGQTQLSLACPLPGPCEPIPPILLFAGEATVPGHFATILGARLSGIREAERVVQLTLQFQGPPVSNFVPGQVQKVKRCA